MNEGTFVVTWIICSALWFVGCIINLIRVARQKDDDGKLQGRIIDGYLALLCTPAAFILVFAVACVLFMVAIIEGPSKLIYKARNRNP
jgi:hypothetical protein